MTTRIAISAERPFQVLDIDSSDSSFLGYDSCELLGQSILILLGPHSDAALLESAIFCASTAATSNYQFIMYKQNAEPCSMMLNSSPLTQGNLLVGFSLILKESQAISLCEAFTESFCPRALVSAEEPNTISFVNKLYSEKFGISPREAHGRSLGSLHSAQWESWASLLGSARRGELARGRVAACGARAPFSRSPPPAEFEDVTCVPVVDAPNGPVRHVLVLFAASPAAELSNSDSDAETVVAVAAAATAAPATPPQRGQCGGSLPRILPRRKACTDGTVAPAAPVVVTPELLDGVRGLPLRRAAEVVGVSPTAFKKACRKLGLRRWAYQRPAGKRGPYLRCRNRVAGVATSAPAAAPVRSRASAAAAGELCSDAPPLDGEWSSAAGRGLGWDGPSESGGSESDSGDEDCAGAAPGPAWAGSAAPLDFLFDEDAPAVDDGLVLQMLAEPWVLQVGRC